ncbi:unnamed protein product, partial [Meganyctiphanes norvegica]
KYRLREVMTDVGLSFQMLKDIILSLNVLVILDGQDESPQNTLLIDLLRHIDTHHNMKLIITTRPGASISLQKIINRYTIPKIDLMLTGIALVKQFEFIRNYVVVMETDKDKQNCILESVSAALPHLNNCMGEILLSPLMLTLLTILWVSGDMPDSATTTHIFMRVNKILKGKLESRLLLKLKTISDDSLKSKLDEFEGYLKEVAYKSFCIKEANFEESTIDLLMKKLKHLELTDVNSEILGHYLFARKTRRGWEQIIQYSYRHLRMQEFDAAIHVVNVITSGNADDVVRIMKEIQDERYVNIRAHTLALLAERNPHHLTKYGRSIVDCEKAIIDKKGILDNRCVDGMLRLVSETQCNNQVVVDMVTVIMAQMPVWVVRSPSCLAALMVLLQQEPPEKLMLDFCGQTQAPAALTGCLPAIAKCDLVLELLLPDTPQEEDPSSPSAAGGGGHDTLLSAATPPGGIATMQQFSGCLHEEGLQRLPHYLESLQVGLSPAALHQLIQSTQQLPQLQSLGIWMRCGNLEDHIDLVGKLQPARDLVDTGVTLYNATDTDCPHIAALLQRCYTATPMYLWLKDSTIT